MADIKDENPNVVEFEPIPESTPVPEPAAPSTEPVPA